MPSDSTPSCPPVAACACGCGKEVGITDAKGRPRRFLWGHNGKLPAPVRLWAKTAKTDGCWTWQGDHDRYGYGRLSVAGHKQKAHCLSYELAYGPIPGDLEIDHLCRNTGCVRPDHLEAVSHRINCLRGVGSSAVHARQTCCLKGHPFDLVNTSFGPDGARTCRTCNRDRERRRRLRVSGRVAEWLR